MSHIRAGYDHDRLPISLYSPGYGRTYFFTCFKVSSAKNNISMCGVIPTTITLVAAKELGATEARLVEYATSGDVSGDYSSVVGYAGFVIK